MANIGQQWWHNSGIVLVALLMVLIAQPFLLAINSSSLVSLIFGIILIYASIGNWNSRLTQAKIIAALLCLVLGTLSYSYPDIRILKVGYIVLCCLVLGLALFTQIDVVIKQKLITKKSLISCINAYILAAYLGASISWLTEIIQPGAFNINHPVITHQLHDFVYFSFVTMATLGYGDITPVSEVAKIVAVLISLFGQLYVTFFIAIILGKYLQQKQQS